MAYRSCSAGVLMVLGLTVASTLGSSLCLPSTAHAEKYQSRLNSLLIRKENLYLPSRLIIGQEAHFVVKAQPGSLVKVFVSTEGEGKILNDELPLRVGNDAQELSGTVPENGVLELKMPVPNNADLDGRLVYIDAVSGPDEQSLKPIDLTDATGRRTEENTVSILKQVAENGPALLPAMPGVSPQVFNQLNTINNIYSQNDSNRKQLMDNGSINRDRNLDRNPFINRGAQQGIGL